MNVDILLELLIDVSEGEGDYRIAKYLNQVVDSLQTLSSAPQDNGAQQALSTVLQALAEELQKRENSFTPKEL
jgi:flagellar hook-associated protein FlgK